MSAEVWTWPHGPSLTPSDELLRTNILSTEAYFPGEFELKGDLCSAFGLDEEEKSFWPNELLSSWEHPFLVLPGCAYATKTALLRRLEQIAQMEGSPVTPLYITQSSFVQELEKEWRRPLDVLLRAAKFQGAQLPEGSEGIVLLVDGWHGSIMALQNFLSTHAVHVAARSERYATVSKAGIGAEESSKHPPLPRFLGARENDSFPQLQDGRIPLRSLIVACDPHGYQLSRLATVMTPLTIHVPSSSECALLVRSMGTDCPSARAAPDAWIAFLCGAAASIPPPVDATAGTPRVLLTSISGALGHLCGKLGISRQVLQGAGFLACMKLAVLQDPQTKPLSERDFLEVCDMYVGSSTINGRPGLFKSASEMFDTIKSAFTPFLAPASPTSLLCFGHPLIEQWLAAQFLSVEDAVSDRALRKAAEKFPFLKEVSGPMSQQSLPFVYSAMCTSSAVWRGVLHFIGIATGVYPLAYRLCAWGDNSNIAGYQWLLQLKSQACSPMPKKSLSQRLAPPMFEYDIHGDLGRQVFWILCRVQAEVSVSNPTQASEHGEENPFPHFIRAVIANPKHAYDLATVLSDAVFSHALARLPDGSSIASHMGDLCLEAGCQRPWAAVCYARILSSLDLVGLLPTGFSSHQFRALSSSKSTTKRLLASAFIRERFNILRCAPPATVTGECYTALEATLLGVSDKSPFVRDESLKTLRSLIYSCSTVAWSEPAVVKLLDDGIMSLASLVRSCMPVLKENGSGPSEENIPAEPTQSKGLTSLLIAASNLLLSGSPYAVIPFLLVHRNVDISSASSIIFALRRSAELASLEHVEDKMFLWRCISTAVVPSVQGSRFVPSDDLLFAVQEFGLVHAPLLRFALHRLLREHAGKIVGPAMRWSEKPMRHEIIVGSLCCPEGQEIFLSLLQGKGGDSMKEELVQGLCSIDATKFIKTDFVIRCVVALAGKRVLQARLLTVLKSMLDGRGWWCRQLSASSLEMLLQLISGGLSLSAIVDVLGVFLSCHQAIPADVIFRLITLLPDTDASADFVLHTLMQLLYHIQGLCDLGLVTPNSNVGGGSSPADALAVVACVANMSPLVPPSLVHSTHVACVRFLAVLAASSEPIRSACFAVIAHNSGCLPPQDEYKFVNPALAVSFCCTVLAQLRDFGGVIPPSFAFNKCCESWAKSSNVLSSLLALTQVLVSHNLVQAADVLPISLVMVLNLDPSFCPIQREAALKLSQVCALASPASASWVTTVFNEVKIRSESIRAEEPGVVAGLKLVRYVLKQADAGGVNELSSVVAVVGTNDAILVSILEHTSQQKAHSKDESSFGWNISVVTEALGVIQHLLSLETRVFQTDGLVGSHVSRYALPLLTLVCDVSGASPDVRKAIIRVLRVLPRSVSVAGLRLFATSARSKGSKWGGMFARKIAKSPSRKGDDDMNAPFEGAPASEYLIPVFRALEKAQHLTDKLALVELLAVAAFPLDSHDLSCVSKTETLLCDFLKSATANVSTELSTVVQRSAHIFVPHIWSMMASSVQSKSLCNKWLSFLRKHYQPEGGRPMPRVTQRELNAVVQGFISATSNSSSLDSQVVFRMFGVFYDIVIQEDDPKLFSDCLVAVQHVCGSMSDPTPSEAKETTLLLMLHLLGKQASISSPTTPYHDFLKPILDSLPYGLGRLYWRIFHAFARTLTF